MWAPTKLRVPWRATHGAALGAVVSGGAFGSRGSSSTRRARLSLLSPFSFGSLWEKASAVSPGLASQLPGARRWPDGCPWTASLRRTAALSQGVRTQWWAGTGQAGLGSCLGSYLLHDALLAPPSGLGSPLAFRGPRGLDCF